MSHLALESNDVVVPSARGVDLSEWKKREAQARSDRGRFEPTWEFCNSFIQGRQWIGWHPQLHRVLDLPNPDDRVRVTVNVLTQYHATFVGKLTSEDFRPDITFRKDQINDQAIARQAQKALIYGWNEEWDGDEAMLSAVRKMVTFGTSAILVRPDPTGGQPLGEMPIGPDGNVIFNRELARAFVAQAQELGQPVQFKNVSEGALAWDVLSPFNILPPPGIEEEKNFPWLIIERPMSLAAIRKMYGERGAAVTEEDVRQIDLIGSASDSGLEGQQRPGNAKLREHALLKTGYETATVEHPYGRMVVWAGDVELGAQDALPFIIKGQGKIGFVPFKYHPQDERFWAIGAVEPMLGPQKQRNRSRSQWTEMKDRAGLGRVFAHKGVITEVNRPKGGVFELVEVMPGHDLPKETQGVPPGPWLAQDVAMCDDDLDKVAGLREVSLGQAPAGVSAYSAFALLAEQDDKRVGPILRNMRVQIAKLTKVTVCGMRTYWVPDKEIVLDGDSDLMDAFTFNAMDMPEDVFIKVSQSAPLPSSPAAEAQKIFDVFDRAIASGQVLPIDWLTQSLADGKMQPLPKREQQVASDKAQYENQILVHGHPVQVAPYDNDELHVQLHRQAQSQLSLIPEYQQAAMMVEQHIQQHLMSAQQKAMQAMPPGGIPGQGSPPSQPQGNGRDAGFGPAGAAAQSQQMQPMPPAVQ